MGRRPLIKNEENKSQAVSLTKTETLPALLKKDDVRKRFEEVLKSKSNSFIASLLTLYNANEQLKQANPISILSASMIAATLDLPINSNLGFAYIIPYGSYAQFQMGYKGYIQLAMRTGQYKTINTTEVYEGEIKNFNRFTGDFEFSDKTSDKIIGYIAYFKLINGFEKYLYMTTEDIIKHAQKYSRSYNNPNAPWQTLFDDMAKKTVLKQLLSKWGILSTELQRAIEADQGVIKNEEIIEYDDTPSKLKLTKADKKEILIIENLTPDIIPLVNDCRVVEETITDIYKNEIICSNVRYISDYDIEKLKNYIGKNVKLYITEENKIKALKI